MKEPVTTVSQLSARAVDCALRGTADCSRPGRARARMVYIDKWEEFMEAAQQVIAPAETDSGRRMLI